MTDTLPTIKEYNGLEELLLDEDLACLGDAYVNFIYSLAMSRKLGKPMGAKVNNQVLAVAVETSGLRKFLPRRVDKHARANAAEALLIFAWLNDLQELDQCIETLITKDSSIDAFAVLLRDILRRLGANHERK